MNSGSQIHSFIYLSKWAVPVLPNGNFQCDGVQGCLTKLFNGSIWVSQIPENFRKWFEYECTSNEFLPDKYCLQPSTIAFNQDIHHCFNAETTTQNWKEEIYYNQQSAYLPTRPWQSSLADAAVRIESRWTLFPSFRQSRITTRNTIRSRTPPPQQHWLLDDETPPQYAAVAFNGSSGEQPSCKPSTMHWKSWSWTNPPIRIVRY